MGEIRRGAKAAAASVVAVALLVLVGAQLVLPAGTSPLSPGRAEASCATSLVYDGVFWQNVRPVDPIVLGDPVDGAVYPPCADTINSDARAEPVAAYRVNGLPLDYLATGTGEDELFRRTSDVYAPVLDARGVVDAIAYALVALVGVGLLVLGVRVVKRRRHEASLPPVPSD